MKEILAANGWIFSGNCTSCSGGAELWRKDGNEYMFKVFTRHNYFLLLKNNHQVFRGNVNDIQNKINEVSQPIQA